MRKHTHKNKLSLKWPICPWNLKMTQILSKPQKWPISCIFGHFINFREKKNGRFLGFRGFFVILEILRYFDHFKGIVGGFYFLFFIFWSFWGFGAILVILEFHGYFLLAWSLEEGGGGYFGHFRGFMGFFFFWRF